MIHWSWYLTSFPNLNKWEKHRQYFLETETGFLVMGSAFPVMVVSPGWSVIRWDMIYVLSHICQHSSRPCTEDLACVPLPKTCMTKLCILIFRELTHCFKRQRSFKSLFLFIEKMKLYVRKKNNWDFIRNISWVNLFEVGSKNNNYCISNMY